MDQKLKQRMTPRKAIKDSKGVQEEQRPYLPEHPLALVTRCATFRAGNGLDLLRLPLPLTSSSPFVIARGVVICTGDALLWLWRDHLLLWSPSQLLPPSGLSPSATLTCLFSNPPRPLLSERRRC